jgi:hypothetical protein
VASPPPTWQCCCFIWTDPVWAARPRQGPVPRCPALSSMSMWFGRRETGRPGQGGQFFRMPAPARRRSEGRGLVQSWRLDEGRQVWTISAIWVVGVGQGFCRIRTVEIGVSQRVTTIPEDSSRFDSRCGLAILKQGGKTGNPSRHRLPSTARFVPAPVRAPGVLPLLTRPARPCPTVPTAFALPGRHVGRSREVTARPEPPAGRRRAPNPGGGRMPESCCPLRVAVGQG